MYKRYKMRIDEGERNAFVQFSQPGEDLYSDFRKSVLSQIANYEMGTSLSINGDIVENIWFPKEEYQIFLSHSNRDKDIAYALAYRLKESMNVNVFVDSLVWGHRDDLIKQLYNSTRGVRWNNACYWGNGVPPSVPDECALYSSIAAHVDAMLNKSLIQVMDDCECLLFLNTPNSISASEVRDKTLSPWIYSELESSLRLRIQEPLRYTNGNFSYNPSREAQVIENRQELRVEHSVPTGHLQPLSLSKFEEWVKTATGKTACEALDVLYNLPFDPKKHNTQYYL